MPTVVLDVETHERLALVAAALGVSDAKAVDVLLRRLAAAPPTTATATEGAVAIHVVYKGVRFDAEFDPATEAVKILTDPLADQRFTSPSRAAIEVVSQVNPSVNPNRNGWGFWVVTESGALLQALRRH